MPPGGIGRQQLEAREAQHLAPWAMRAGESRGRDHRHDRDEFRTEFQRDRDRIVHSRAFRRLAYKTQVFTNDEGDLFRTRLTHTMELAQLARSAACRLALNEDLVECLALAHDLGHPPFGHRGEDMLDELMTAHGGFDHHRQTLRIVEELEHRYAGFDGLDLTWEVRESLAKLGKPVGDAGIPRRFERDSGALLEAQLVDEIDSIAYDCHDIDDGLRAGVLSLGQLSELELWRGAWEQAVSQAPRSAGDKVLVDHTVRILCSALLGDLIEHSEREIAAAGIDGLAAVRSATRPLIVLGPLMREAKAELERFLFEQLYRDWRVNRTFHKARRILAELFEHFCAHPDVLPDEHQARVAVVGCERAVADYLAGMTDRFARDEWLRLFAPSRGGW